MKLLAYSLRSIWARRLSTIPALIATAVAIGGSAWSAAYLQGFSDAVSNTSRSVAVIASPRIAGESGSSMEREQVLRAAVLGADSGRRSPVSMKTRVTAQRRSHCIASW